MTPRTPKPKPVEAWAVLIGENYQQFADGAPLLYMRKPIPLWTYMRVVRVRIVPVTRKPKSKTRTKRKEKKK